MSKAIDPRSGGAGEGWRQRNIKALIRSRAGQASFRVGPMPLIYRTILLRHVLLPRGQRVFINAVPVKHHGDWMGRRPGFPMG